MDDVKPYVCADEDIRQEMVILYLIGVDVCVLMTEYDMDAESVWNILEHRGVKLRYRADAVVQDALKMWVMLRTLRSMASVRTTPGRFPRSTLGTISRGIYGRIRSQNNRPSYEVVMECGLSPLF